jgi:hypothetical protein
MLAIIILALAALIITMVWPLEPNKQSKPREVRRRPF